MHRVYLTYSDEGDLLYVGVAKDVEARLRQHQYSSYWYDRMAYHKFRKFECRARALAFERRAIRWLKPIFNKSGLTIHVKADPKAPPIENAETIRRWKRDGFPWLDEEPDE